MNAGDSYSNGSALIVAMCVLVCGFAAKAEGNLRNDTDTTLRVGNQKQLFADDFVIAEMRNVTREVGQAKKLGVVLGPTLPTDFQTGKVHDGPDGGAGYVYGASCFCWFFSPHWDQDCTVENLSMLAKPLLRLLRNWKHGQDEQIAKTDSASSSRVGQATASNLFPQV